MDQAIKNLMFDYVEGKEIYDVDLDKVMSKDAINDKMSQICFEYTGLTPSSTKKQIRKAFNTDKGKAFLSVLEEVIEKKVSLGLDNIDFVREYVEEINVAKGDRQDFYTEEETILLLEDMAANHHDLIIQQLKEGTPVIIPTKVYGCKVGQDITLFVTGKKKWSDFVDAIPKAYVKMLYEAITAKLMGVATALSLPADCTGSGALSSSTKDDFDALIEFISALNNNAGVILAGTKTALKKINNLIPAGNAVNWMADSQKESIAKTGMLGDYEGTNLVEIPQRFASVDIDSGIIDNTKILILPLGASDNKFIKYINGGETSLEITDRGKTLNDQQTFEVQREIGIGVVLAKYIGVWTISD